MKKLNRYDQWLVVILVIGSTLLYGSLSWLVNAVNAGQRIAIVSYKDAEILRIDMSINNTYIVQGTLGEVVIEVQDQRIRVERETSPYNLCSIQGWVSSSMVPITCLPNHIIIVIVAPKEGDIDFEVK
jgi:hypothetical protein